MNQRTRLPNSPRHASGPLVAVDQRTFELGLIALVPELRGRARKLSGSDALADDVVQDTIARALRFSRQYERGTNLRAWIHQILFSVFVTQFRRARRDRHALRALAADPHAWTVPERFVRPDAALSLSKGMRDRLAALPDAFRAVVELIDLEELTYREVANELGLPVGTVMSRAHRGRKLLAAELREVA